jgi:hypothetical protein
MNSWRIQTFFEDKSNVVKPSTSALAFTAIKAMKGTTEPTYFDVGQDRKIINVLGYPAYDNGVQEVIDYNKKAPIYVSAPSKNGKYGGVFITTLGSIPFVNGYNSSDDFDLESVDRSSEIGEGDAVTTTFTINMDYYSQYIPHTLSILIDGSADTLVFSDPDPDGFEEFTGDLLIGTFNKLTGEVAIEFTSAPSLKAEISMEYAVDFSNITYFVLRSYSKSNDDTSVKVVSLGNGLFNLFVAIKDYTNEYLEDNDSPIKVSLNPFGKDDNGRNIYIENVLKNNVYIRGLDTEVEFSTFTDDTDFVLFNGGDRGDELEDTDIATAFSAIKDVNKYPIKVFFSNLASSTIATTFETMRNTLYPRSRFLLITPDVTAQELITGDSTSKYNLSNRGIYVYCLTWGTHVDSYRGNDFYCSNIGLIASRHADSINSKYKGGIGPLWIDENGVGGELGSSIIELSQDSTETELQQLDSLHLNAIKFDFSLGPIITSQRTTLNTEGDYSYIGHSGLADYIADNVEKLVLPYQIGKLNDIFHRGVAKSNAEVILNGVRELLYDYHVKCDEENNNSDILNQKKFVLTIGVQYTPQSETIDFIFINSPTGVDIKEVVNRG